MQRIPEPDLMDDKAQARAYAEADFTEPHENFITLFKGQWPGRAISGRVLDLGCGPADISIRFARAFPDCTVEGVDGAAEMLACGAGAVAAAGMSHCIDLSHCYLPSERLMQQSYEAVISNSLLHHLIEPMTLWRTIAACTKSDVASGTPVFVMDLMRPQNHNEAKHFVSSYAGEEPAILQHDFYHSLLAAYTVDEVREQLNAAGLHALKVEAASDRHLIVAGLL